MTAVPGSVILLVDPLRAGVKLPQLFNGLGYRCVAVLSAESCSPFWRESFRPGDFLRILHESDGLESILAGLRGFRVAAVVPGGESGVDLAGRLAPHFPAAPGLDPARAHARRDKFAMAEVLRRSGLAAIAHL